MSRRWLTPTFWFGSGKLQTFAPCSCYWMLDRSLLQHGVPECRVKKTPDGCSKDPLTTQVSSSAAMPANKCEFGAHLASPDHAPRGPFLHLRAAHARRRPARPDRCAATHS